MTSGFVSLQDVVQLNQYRLNEDIGKVSTQVDKEKLHS